jgi:UDP-N-acetylglucosamine transferase subunit ALG13
MDQTAFAEAFAKADVIVSHAGMGTILSATEIGKPIVLMPRRADMGEHRNNHQLDTAAEMSALANVTVVHGLEDLSRDLDRVLAQPVAVGQGSAVASAELIGNLSRFIAQKPAKKRVGRLQSLLARLFGADRQRQSPQGQGMSRAG